MLTILYVECTDVSATYGSGAIDHDDVIGDGPLITSHELSRWLDCPEQNTAAAASSVCGAVWPHAPPLRVSDPTVNELQPSFECRASRFDCLMFMGM